MKKMLICVLFFNTVTGMQQSKLARTYSICPTITVLEQAISGGNPEQIAQTIQGLPQNLIPQHILLKRASSVDIKALFLNYIKAYWLRCVIMDICSTIDRIKREYRQLSSQAIVDHDFLVMLTAIKGEVIKKVEGDPLLYKCALRLPGFPNPRPLTKLAARVIRHELKGEDLSRLSGDEMDLVDAGSSLESATPSPAS